MSLSNKVITDFVKTTSNNKTKKQDTIVKGWIAKNKTGVYSVKLAEYSDDNTLAELIYDVLFISIVRPYEEKTKEHFVVIPFDASDYETPVIEQKADAPTVNTNSQATPDTLFANSEYLPPCQHFCGHAPDIDALNTL